MVKSSKQESGRGQKWKNSSEWFRYHIERGQQFEALLSIYNNPEKRKEFEAKLSGIAKAVDIEKYMATIDDPQMLDSIIFTATNMKEAKVKQLLLDFQSH